MWYAIMYIWAGATAIWIVRAYTAPQAYPWKERIVDGLLWPVTIPVNLIANWRDDRNARKYEEAMARRYEELLDDPESQPGTIFFTEDGHVEDES